MKTSHIVVIVIISVAIILGLIVGLGVRGFVLGGKRGNIGVIEIEEIITSAKTIVKDLKALKEDPSIQAIIIRIDSPGGGVTASQEIYDEIKKVKETKKVVASMGTVAASGGYFVSLPADVIVANPATITGSIGVIMEIPIIDELLKKIGIQFEVIKSKEFKDIGSPFRPMKDKEKKLLNGVVLDVYAQFIDAIAENRKLSKDSILKFADGRILTGRQAKEIGLVDTLGSFEDAVKIAGDLIGVEKPNLIYPFKRMSFIDLLIKPTEMLLIPKLEYLWK